MPQPQDQPTVRQAAAPIKARLRNASGEVARRKVKNYKTSPAHPIHRPIKRNTGSRRRWHPPITAIAARIAHQACSAEFWLGMVFGIATRVTAKLALTAVLTPAHGLLSATVASYVACALAGMAAGIVVHWVRMLYRNAHIRHKQDKETYGGKALLVSAVTGLMGGWVGGFASHAGAAVARAGSLAVGLTAGATAGVVHAAVKTYRNARRRHTTQGWGRLALQGIGYGAVGGMIGVVSTDILGAASSLASPFSDTAPQLTLPLSNPDLLSSGKLLAPIHVVTVSTQDSASFANTPCAAAVHHAPIHHAAKHVVHAKPPPPFDTVIVIEPPWTPPPPQLPPLAVVPIVGPPPEPPPLPRNPCDFTIAPHYTSTSQLHLKGPCADPGVACVERVSFNADGDATGVVLEPGSARQTGAHFEVAASQTTAQNTGTSSQPDAAKISLVVPFNGIAPAYGEPSLA